MSDDSSLSLSLSTVDEAEAPSRPRPRRVVEPLCRASSRAGLGHLADRLEEVRLFMGADLSDIEAQLGSLSSRDGDGDRARRAAGHLLARPGKRIRPLCVMLGARLAGLPVDASVRDVAVACELVHAATLLHDDVIDEGTERRGAPAARMVYGNSASILAGDYLLVAALERVARAAAAHGRDGRLLQSLLETIVQMVAAEALQLEQRGRFAPSRESYLEIIDGKTASLFRWALSAAALLGGLPEEHCDALARAGSALGCAFQLIDDVLDLEGDPHAVGKDLLADLAQGKMTWPLILAVERDPRLEADLRRGSTNGAAAAQRAHWIERIIASGALHDTRAFADVHRRRARDALATLPDSSARQALEVVVDAAVERRK